MKKLDFIGQFRAFIKLSAGKLDPKEQLIYFRLLGIWNELRRPEWFPVSIKQLMRESGIGRRNTIADVRHSLERKGFIRSRRLKRTSIVEYHLEPLTSINTIPETSISTIPANQTSINMIPDKYQADTSTSINLIHIPESTKNKDYIAAAATRACAREGDQNLSEVVQAFSNNIHPVTGEIELGKLTSFLDDFGKDWTLAAITEAAENNGRSVRYIEAILERWKRDGFQSERRGEHGGARKHSAGTAGHSGESEKVRRRAEELAKFRAEYNAKIERERKAREAARSAESH